MRWKVVNGGNIIVWGDACLGGDGSSKLIIHMRGSSETSYVALYIDEDKREWNIILVLISSTYSDKTCWAESLNGVFQVLYAYNLTLKQYDFSYASNG